MIVGSGLFAANVASFDVPFAASLLITGLGAVAGGIISGTLFHTRSKIDAIRVKIIETIAVLAKSGKNAEAVANAIWMLPENLRTSEIIALLAKSGANAEAVVDAIRWLPENFRISETIALLAKSGKNAILVARAIRMLPESLRTSENIAVLVTSGVNIEAVVDAMRSECRSCC